jgi:arylsulfatase A-like enzyme
MKKSSILVILFLISHVVFAQGQDKQTPQPNIVLIFIDDLGYGDLGIYGHPTINTPNLDQLANEGMKLTSFYAAASVCTPSRAALMTGLYPLSAGLHYNLGPDSDGGLPLSQKTIASSLQEVGYKTAAYGKWHLGAVPGYMPTDRGFDEYLGLLYSNDMIPPWVNTTRALQLYKNDQAIPEELDQSLLTQKYTNAAIEFIKTNRTSPFFVYMAHSMPHVPIYASQKFKEKSAGGDYGDVIEEIDFTVGKIREALEREGLAKNTLIIFTSDNGPWRNLPPRMFSNDEVAPWHGGSTGALAGAKGTSYEGGFRVPAIFNWPDTIPDGQVNTQMASTLDVHATLLSLAGIDNANLDELKLDGYDLLPMLTKNAPSPRNEFYYFTGSYLDAVRDKRWKLRISYKADDWISPEINTGEEPIIIELFDLQNDPFEQFNRANEYPEHVTRLHALMQAKANQIGAKLRKPTTSLP